jgi:hypothetical protein
VSGAWRLSASGLSASGLATSGLSIETVLAVTEPDLASAVASAPVEERASTAAIHDRYSVAISAADAPVNRANFSMTPYSGGTVSPCTYRCSVEVPTCNRLARTP